MKQSFTIWLGAVGLACLAVGCSKPVYLYVAKHQAFIEIKSVDLYGGYRAHELRSPDRIGDMGREAFTARFETDIGHTGLLTFMDSCGYELLDRTPIHPFLFYPFNPSGTNYSLLFKRKPGMEISTN